MRLFDISINIRESTILTICESDPKICNESIITMINEKGFYIRSLHRDTGYYIVDIDFPWSRKDTVFILLVNECIEYNRQLMLEELGI